MDSAHLRNSIQKVKWPTSFSRATNGSGLRLRRKASEASRNLHNLFKDIRTEGRDPLNQRPSLSKS
eukprot:10373626-Karenia_brevis.AAC.1